MITVPLLITVLALVFLGVEAFRSRSYGWGGLFFWCLAEAIGGLVQVVH